MSLDRAALLADTGLRGHAWCTAHTDVVDAWLVSLLQTATDGNVNGLTLVAVGGYGRAELSPQSDIDVMLLHAGRRDVAQVADRVWYPIWDEHVKLGHSVCTVKEALKLAADDLDTATALLSARYVAGDGSLAEELGAAARTQWARKSSRWLTALADRVDERHAIAGEVAFQLEPDLKDGRGGLRDAHSLHWAEAATAVLHEVDHAALGAAYAVLLDARVELHRHSQRASNTLAVAAQPVVARALGDQSGDALMDRVADAARTIAWTSDDTWRRIRQRPGSSSRQGVNELALDSRADAADPLVALEAAAMAAQQGVPLARASLERFAAEMQPIADPWPDGARRVFVDLLAAGAPAVGVIEGLDRRGVWTRLLPEWNDVRARRPRRPYHRYTADRHALETVAAAAGLAPKVERPDILLVAALLHGLDTGTAAAVAERMGFAPDDVAALTAVVDQRNLLVKTANRRDLGDPATVRHVADRVEAVPQLQLLAAFTEAEATATGPLAWEPRKAALVAQLVRQVTALLQGDVPVATSEVGFPTVTQVRDLATGGETIEAQDDTLTVMVDDRPGLFSRAAGVLALHGLDVVAADAYSDNGRALSQFRVVDAYRPQIPWARVIDDLRRAFAGELALAARVAERASVYGPRRASPAPPPTIVHFDNDVSPSATVIDIETEDAVGVLYRITRAFLDLDLDIRTAKVHTLGTHVIDAFYVLRRGAKITDPALLAEIERAILFNLAA